MTFFTGGGNYCSMRTCDTPSSEVYPRSETPGQIALGRVWRPRGIFRGGGVYRIGGSGASSPYIVNQIHQSHPMAKNRFSPGSRDFYIFRNVSARTKKN